LRSLAAAGLISDLAADDDFSSLRDSDEYAAVVRQTEQNRQPVAASTPLQTLTERDRAPVVSSVRKIDLRGRPI